MNRAQVAAFVKENDGGEIHKIYGPNRIGRASVWEVWAHDNDEFQTRYVYERPSHDPQYFEQFEDLCANLDGFAGDGARVVHAERVEMLKYWGGLGALALTLPAFTFVFLTRPDNAIVTHILAAVIASVLTYLVGKFVVPRFGNNV